METMPYIAAVIFNIATFLLARLSGYADADGNGREATAFTVAACICNAIATGFMLNIGGAK